MFGCYIKERKKKKKTEKWGSGGVNCEEEMREKKMKWVRGDVCVRWGRRKKKGRVHGWWGKKKKGKKKWEVGFTVEKKKGMKNK